MSITESDIIRSIDVSPYTWRTYKGLATDLGTSETDINNIILSMNGKILKSRKSDGTIVITTKEKYERVTPITKKIISVLSGTPK